MHIKETTFNTICFILSIIIIVGGTSLTAKTVYQSDEFNQSIDNQIASWPVDMIKEGRVTYIIVNGSGRIIDVEPILHRPKFKRIELNSSSEFITKTNGSPVYSFMETGYSSCNSIGIEFVSKTYVSFIPNSSGIYMYKDVYTHNGYYVDNFDDNNIHWYNNNGWFTLIVVVIVFFVLFALCIFLHDRIHKEVFGD